MNRSNVISAALALVLITVTGLLAWHWWPLADDRSADENLAGSESTEDGASLRADASTAVAFPVVTLNEAKANVAGIETIVVQRGTFVMTRTVPARFAYDDRQHVSVRAPADCIVLSVDVKPGDPVQAGARIAVVQSADVGRARSVLLQRQAELKLAESARQWASDIQDGVRELAKRIKANVPSEQIRSELRKATLGTFGGQLLTLYNQSKLANQLASTAASSPGAISGRVVSQRQSEQQEKQAELEALIEQSIFETKQEFNTATAKSEAARREVLVARQTLAALLGGLGNQDIDLDVSPNESLLSQLEVVSPLSGTVERLVYSATERVKPGDEMFVIADTNRLWVQADIRGRDWNAMQIKAKDNVSVIVPATDTRITGAVHYVGRQVDPASGAVPLVIEVNNDQGLFRPGLFCRVEIPVQVIDDVLAVPESAVLDVDGQPSVFVSEGIGYRATPVEIGAASSGQIEIRSGLRKGQTVVTAGAFVLKSEVLLEGEE